MAIIYRGVSDFTLQSEEPARPYFELPTLAQVWKGASTKYAAFVAAHKEGSAFAGGYIIEARGRDQGMYPEVYLTIALPPNFQAYTVASSKANQTSSKGRTVATTQVIEGATAVEAQAKMSFIAHQTVYSYFASQFPTGPRFSNPVEKGTPILQGRIITATVAEGKAVEGEPSTKTYYGNAPAPLSSALSMPAAGRIIGPDAQPIPGTPWYKCQDVVSWGFWGDD